MERALPVMSVDTIKHAKELQILCCSHRYDGSYSITPQSGFIRGNIDTLIESGLWLEKMYLKVIKKETK